jgi:hypothetical protein
MGLLAYGAIYTQDGSATQALTLGELDKLLLFTHNGISKNTTPDYENNQIVVENPGDYEISGSFSFSFSVGNMLLEIHPAKNGTEIDPGIHRKIGAANDVGAASFCILETLSAEDIISVVVEPSASGDIKIEEASLIVKRID